MYPEVILIFIIGFLSYFSYKYVIYPYYLGPLSYLPRPKNAFSYIYNLYTSKLKGDCEYLLNLNLEHGPVVHLLGSIVLLSDTLMKKCITNSKFKKSSHYESFDFSGKVNLFSVRDRDQHSKIKKLVSPAFSLKTLSSIENIVYNIGSQGLVNYIESKMKSNNQEVFDFYHLFHCSTFDVITQIVFGTNYETLSNEENAQKYVNVVAETQKSMFLRSIVPFIKYFAFPIEKLFKEIIIENIKLRENSPNPDILQSLIDSEDPETGEKLTHEEIAQECMILEDPETGEKLSHDEIARECLILLLAGMDTTAITLSWTLYMILKNPEIYKLVEDEVLEKFPNFNEPVSSEKAKNSLKYLEAALLESMRMHPVASGGIPRVVPEGGITANGHFLPHKTVIFFPIYSQHHDPTLWEDPSKFDISRWLGPNKEKNKSQLISFSVGPRSCIGRELAWNEMYLVLTNIIRNFKMELVDTDLTPTNKFLYRPLEKRMRVRMEKRY
ncbi:cytochrome P450 [Conidiobolus coronatus NRRL 28638]|uniref:Cytochrome P450 n=1 Tax=Conidiobolus coronatus (strain ATCC 28846 / CBS 209.66 / NRRL 28638) TaxID=796925 RepID=A0A137PI62_CONC2|nr:cytochrome P450 [Conidiobolus coronatus NRRL 28638]|eukprot:KXN74682.1 cytochrome P450 [Conidiobolus coronatus NRRL 28638]